MRPGTAERLRRAIAEASSGTRGGRNRGVVSHRRGAARRRSIRGLQEVTRRRVLLVPVEARALSPCQDHRGRAARWIPRQEHHRQGCLWKSLPDRAPRRAKRCGEEAVEFIRQADIQSSQERDESTGENPAQEHRQDAGILLLGGRGQHHL